MRNINRLNRLASKTKIVAPTPVQTRKMGVAPVAEAMRAVDPAGEWSVSVSNMPKPASATAKARAHHGSRNLVPNSW